MCPFSVKLYHFSLIYYILKELFLIPVESHAYLFTLFNIVNRMVVLG